MLKLSRVSMVSFVICAGASCTSVLGCYAGVGAGVGPQPVEVTASDEYVYEQAPPQVETYPAVVYEGSPHYYVNGRWYRKTPRGWAYYRREPVHLAQRRPAPHREESREERKEERKEDRKEERKEERKNEHR